MRKNKMFAYLTGALVTALVLAGCGSDKSYATSEEAYADYPEEYYSDDLYEMAEEASMAEPEMYSAKMADSSAEAPAEMNGEISSEQLEAKSSNRKLIKNVNLSVQTKEFDKLINTITSRIDALGGYAESLNVNGYSYNASSTSTRSAYITARIPAKNLDSFVNTISENSNITSKNESVSDVTLEYSDVEARRNSLRIEQERLNELLKQAESVDIIIELENRLTDVRYELESYESRLRSLDNNVDYSTVYIDINEVKDYTSVVTPEKSFGERVSEGFLNGCSDAVEVLKDFVVGLAQILPRLLVVLIILGVFGLIIFAIVKLIIRIVKKSNNKKKAARTAAANRVGADEVRAPSEDIIVEQQEAK